METNEKNNMLYFSQDVVEILIVIENDKFRINENIVKHFSRDTKYLGKLDIDKEQFYEFANYLISTTNGWNEPFLVKIINSDVRWSITIKTNNNGTKRYAGKEYVPNNWDDFYNNFVAFLRNKSIIQNNNLTTIPDNTSEVSNNDNKKFEDIIKNEYYYYGITNRLIDDITKFITFVIEESYPDKFWSDSAREFLGLLILSNLVSNTELNTKNLIIQINNIAILKDIILNNINKLNTKPELQIFTYNVNVLNSDRTLGSLLELINNGLLKYYEQTATEDDYKYDYENDTKTIIIPKKISEISQETLSNIYSYTMHTHELEQLKLLEIDTKKYERWLNNIKYINNIGYVVVNYIYAMVNENGKRYEKIIYSLKVKPEMNLNNAKKKISKYLNDCYNEFND